MICRSIGKAPGSILVSYSIHRAAEIPEAARELGLGDDELVHSIIRIRTADDTIMALSYTYLPVSLFPNFDLRMLRVPFTIISRSTMTLIPQTAPAQSVRFFLPHSKKNG